MYNLLYMLLILFWCFFDDNNFSYFALGTLITLFGKHVTDNYLELNFVFNFLQRQLDSESSKVSSKKAMEKIEMLNNRRQEVSIGLRTCILCIPWGMVALWLVHSPLDQAARV